MSKDGSPRGADFLATSEQPFPVTVVATAAPEAQPAGNDRAWPALSRRQAEVATLLALGAPATEIAERRDRALTRAHGSAVVTCGCPVAEALQDQEAA